MLTASFATAYHTPVLSHAVLDYLITDIDGLYVDATAGGGGHIAALLSELSPNGRIIAVDRDPSAIHAVESRFPDAIDQKQLVVLRGAFGHLKTLIREFLPVTGLLLDLGVSSHQLDAGERGFSHRKNARLDMRMDPSSSTTAADIVNGSSEKNLVRVLRRYGEEPHARRIGQSIVKHRPVETTIDLASIIRNAVPTKVESRAVARTFQALRIAVNQELDELAQILESSPHIVSEQGRMVIISYHSLEDRMAKRMIRHGALHGDAHRDIYGNRLVPWKQLTRRPVMPDQVEVNANPRSRSARLRAGSRTSLSSNDSH